MITKIWAISKGLFADLKDNYNLILHFYSWNSTKKIGATPTKVIYSSKKQKKIKESA